MKGEGINKVVMVYDQFAFQIKIYLDVIYVKIIQKILSKKLLFSEKCIKYLEIFLF